MPPPRSELARRIRRVVEDPVINLIKGLCLLAIGLSEASRTLREDLVHGRLRVGHGLILIGVFGILGVLPDILDGLESAGRSLSDRAAVEPAPKQGGDAAE